MQFFATLSAALLATAVGAQSPLAVTPAGGALFIWPVPSPSHQTFFDLTVHTTITLRALAAPLVSPAGQRGTMELWLTNPGITSYTGNETNAGRWHRAASGIVVANGTTGSTAQLMCLSCQDASGSGLVLAPGSYGCAIRYAGTANQFCAVPAVPNVFANAELTLTGGAVQYTAFTSPPASPGGGYAGWSWYGAIHYGNGAVPHACAESIPYGSGCLVRHASIYGRYPSARAAASALDRRSLSFVPNQLGAYDVRPGLATHGYLAPTAAALAVPATNDGEYQQPLTIPFVYPGGVATSLFIHSNGFVSVASNNVLTGVNWFPSVGAFLNAPATGWWIWHDLNPTELGSGSIWFEEDPTNGRIYVTWLRVESFPAGVANPSTFQMMFEPGTGIVTMHFRSLDPVGGATLPPGDGWIVGYSPGGASPDPGPTDLRALMGGTAPPVRLPPGEVARLALNAGSRPRLGTTITLTTVNETGRSIGFTFLATRAVEPGLDLTALGAPGCTGLVDLAAGVGIPLANAGGGAGMSVAVPIPNNPGLLGAVVPGQSAWFDPTANALGIVTSNGLRLALGNY